MRRLSGLGLLVLVLGLGWSGPTAAAEPVPGRTLRLAVYDDAGGTGPAFRSLLAALAEQPNWKVERLKASDIRRGKLAGCDVLLMPGGMSATQGATLGEDGREVVQNFVREGGAYIGICAGAYLASCDYPWSLNILNAKVLDKEHWGRGFGKLDITLPKQGCAVFGCADTINIYYHQGPLLAPAEKPDLPAFETLALFEGEMAKNGAPSGVMKGTTAIATAMYGKGRVLCFSPHPEMTDGLHNMLHRGIGFVTATAAPAHRIEVIGHRGASADAPENTLSSIKMAWEHGADAAEFDVFLSKDGHPVVIHDANTKRVAGVDKKVADQTLAELKALDVGTWKGAKFAGEKIPTLAEVLATVPSGKRVFIEIKSPPESVPAILRVVKESGLKPEQLAVISFSADVVAASKKVRAEVPAYWIVSLEPTKAKKTPKAEDLIAKAKEIHADGLDLSATPALTSAYATRVKASGLSLYVWTANENSVVKRMIELGVNGITTDRPKWLREQMK